MEDRIQAEMPGRGSSQSPSKILVVIPPICASGSSARSTEARAQRRILILRMMSGANKRKIMPGLVGGGEHVQFALKVLRHLQAVRGAGSVG